MNFSNAELQKIDKWGEYFHLELLKFYYNFIKFYQQEENKDDEILLFEFTKEEVYAIRYDLLKDKAFEESQKLNAKYEKNN